ncbi:hypothetical protein LC608_19750 [Nostoc sp. XA010]|uniref:hypothetical protein n=1 Tax=Nostoc sp. XA010 TaxID=2780407 RepID=UPI001E363F4D|nr:hypothetical protein [Nostoc sp. XA010]MCC5659172.1 hypothetical protein [Nostoc sp. XA010]
MHISITDDLKKRFHKAYALRWLKISHVVVGMIEQWLANKAHSVNELEGQETVVNLSLLAVQLM